ncbi:MAG: ornithine carbamoyltransferase [Chloroflexi bacterium]|jgi:ornithine carbamoyltransferase|nr:ornithine carbamoyltransferase [Chloroflexota bacterium]
MRHFLNIADWSAPEMEALLKQAVYLKLEWQNGGNRPVLSGKLLAMIFQKPSLRTRVSFQVAMKHLGGDAIYLSSDEIGLGKRESIPDVARVLSGYVQGIVARVFSHDHLTQLAAAASVPIINGLSDSSHPCQAFADMLTLYEHFGTLRGLTIAYVGDSNNVVFSLGEAAARYGVALRVASPRGYQLSEAAIAHLRGMGLALSLTDDPRAAVEGVDCIYTDTWTSMGQEAEAEVRRRVFPPYQVNADLVRLAAKHVVVMHCLPAHRGEEITDEVADGAHSLIFQQAANRLHAQKAILARLLGS